MGLLQFGDKEQAISGFNVRGSQVFIVRGEFNFKIIQLSTAVYRAGSQSYLDGRTVTSSRKQ